MKKTYIGYSVLAAVLALSAQQANAQQGFGTDKPSKASVVEMTSGSKGLLIPRVALTSLDSFAPVSGEAPTDVDKTDALLVYNTATSDAAVADEEKVTPGYYYWTTDGTSGKWNRLASDADIPTEPWKIQNTDTEATDNADNIYQQGKVAVGFTDADGVSDKQLEVKGDFKAQVTDGDIIYGTEIDNPLMPAQSTAHYWMNMTTGAYKVATVRADAAIIESNGTATSSIFNAEDSHATMASLQKNGNAKSEIRTENIGNFFMETYNVTDNYGSTISLQNDGLRMVHSETEGAGPNWLSQNNKSEIFVEKEEGVRFSFNDEDGDPKGEYWFPTTTGAAGHVLTRVGGNQTDWSNVSDLIEVSNGLEKNATDVIQLGGNLIKDTKITLDENELEIDATDSDLIISGLDNTKVQATNATTGITDHLLAVDANNNVKALKAAMPKFFYMPSIIIPTSEEQLDAPGSGKLTGDDFDNTSREGTINLYNRYAAQFGGSTLIKSETAAPVLPVLPSGELYYYVTWYDTNVFTSVSVDDEGVLTYEVDENADITVGSFMNIVFAIKEDL